MTLYAISATNVVEFFGKRRKINDGGHYPAAHNGLVAGSSPAGPTKNISDLRLRCPHRDDRARYVHFSFVRKFEDYGKLAWW
ncbi:hypothetical protein QA645_40855 [Bradyrhizobium sp. CIAT3101]|uniref:hypothetical protein n=1 Tax=Bradyrhizobium sp. CIAT3101 TaxID=439387 RepID=UPI0024B156E9|nr:hypothetical protein [Bradyrhizobium sp. CIAT3101]WFU80704.1 hypothetical protein QA645_40855 [Bradyrhizobium sp. CIAT3101]